MRRKQPLPSPEKMAEALPSHKMPDGRTFAEVWGPKDSAFMYQYILKRVRIRNHLAAAAQFRPRLKAGKAKIEKAENA